MKALARLFSGLVLAFAFSTGYSQTDYSINFLNYSTSSFTATYDHGTKVRVRIDNVNRFIYKVTSEKSEEDFNTTPPDVLSTIKLPAFATSKMPAPNAVPTSKAVTPGTATQLQQDIDNKFKDLLIALRHINVAIDEHNKAVHESKDCAKDFATIEGNVKTIIAAVVGGSPADAMTVLANSLETHLATKIQLANNAVNDLEELLDKWNAKWKQDFRVKQIVDDDALAKLNNELAGLQTVKPVNAVKVDAKKKEIRDQERSIKNSQEDYDAEVKANDEILENAKELLADISKYKEDGKFFQIADDIKKVNSSNYTFYSETVEMKKDEYKFTISAVADDLLVCNRPNEQKFEVSLRTKGGLKVDFSTGFFAMGGSKDFLGTSYYYRPIDKDQSSIASVQQGKGALLGVGGLLHLYRRSPRKFKVGGTAGFSSTMNFDAMNFHLGFSGIIGDKDRLCVSIGLTAREVTLLDSRYEVDKPYDAVILPESVPTYKMFPKYGWFFSLTYNLSSIGKKE